jgi:cytochrome c peroxidase
MKKRISILILMLFLIMSFGISKTEIFFVPKGWPKPQYDFQKNQLTKEQILLGRVLFYDPILSADSSISCNSCHSQFSGFTHVDHSLSHGIKDRIGTRNSPVLMNLAWNKSFMWDGAVNHLDVQALAPISNHDEMDENMEHVVMKLQRSGLYTSLFTNAYGDEKITGERTLKALSQFMLTLVCYNSKYDSVMRNESHFTLQEENGYKLFQKNCGSCHAEPLFTNGEFENNGLSVDTTLNDHGRYKVTLKPQDSLRFKVPTLRNIEFSYPYMHDGRFKKLGEVLDHYNNGIVKHSTLSKPLLEPITLTSNEKVDLMAFLLTLTDRSFLFDKRFGYPKEIFSK